MRLTLRADANRIEAVFTDDGVAVDLAATRSRPRHELAESGRGLVLARATLDEFTYDRAGELNVWRLVRRRSGQSAPD
jgi:serine/threonine-protein kinase RsbW